MPVADAHPYLNLQKSIDEMVSESQPPHQIVNLLFELVIVDDLGRELILVDDLVRELTF